MLIENLSIVIPRERFSPDQHLEHTATERVKIGFTGKCRVARDLLRCHVGVGSYRHPRRTDVGPLQVSGQAEVAKLDVAVGRHIAKKINQPISETPMPISQEIATRSCPSRNKDDSDQAMVPPITIVSVRRTSPDSIRKAATVKPAP